MTLGLICKHYGLSWADARSLRLFEVKALVDHLNSEARRQEAEARSPRR